MGTVGLAVTGGGFFNHLSNPNGALALTNEGPTLDSCLGHSAGGGTYHYHANINCTDAGAATGANDAETCLKIGYYRDGVPVYGFCQDTTGMLMTSCYSLVSGSTTSTVVTVSGTYEAASTSTDYEYNPTSDCNLDEGNGKTNIKVHSNYFNPLSRCNPPHHRGVLLLHDHRLSMDSCQLQRGPGRQQAMWTRLVVKYRFNKLLINTATVSLNHLISLGRDWAEIFPDSNTIQRCF